MARTFGAQKENPHKSFREMKYVEMLLGSYPSLSKCTASMLLAKYLMELGAFLMKLSDLNQWIYICKLLILELRLSPQLINLRHHKYGYKSVVLADIELKVVVVVASTDTFHTTL